jgi:hypothetical protein
MKCESSTGTHVAAPGCASAGASRAREVATQFEALLFESALKPLSDSLGFYGEIVTGEMATAIARRSGGALEAALERAVARDGA